MPTVTITKWRLCDLANRPIALGDGGFSQPPPEPCWFAIVNRDVSPPEPILPSDDLDLALGPLDPMDEVQLMGKTGCVVSRDPIRQHLADWFYFFVEHGPSKRIDANGESRYVTYLYQKAVDMNAGGKIAFVDREQNQTTVKAITTSDAWRVIAEIPPCDAISRNTVHFLSLVLRAMDRWKELDNDVRVGKAATALPQPGAPRGGLDQGQSSGDVQHDPKEFITVETLYAEFSVAPRKKQNLRQALYRAMNSSKIDFRYDNSNPLDKRVQYERKRAEEIARRYKGH